MNNRSCNTYCQASDPKDSLNRKLIKQVVIKTFVHILVPWDFHPFSSVHYFATFTNREHPEKVNKLRCPGPAAQDMANGASVLLRTVLEIDGGAL